MVGRRSFFGALMGGIAGLFGVKAVATTESPEPNYLLSTFDAREWAKEFCRIVGKKIPAIRSNEDWMMGWFANAIMTGYDHGRRHYEYPVPPLMTPERAVEVLNRHKHRGLKWTMAHDVESREPWGRWAYGQGNCPVPDDAGWPDYQPIPEFELIAVAEKLEREHAAVVREFTSHMI